MFGDCSLWLTELIQHLHANFDRKNEKKNKENDLEQADELKVKNIFLNFQKKYKNIFIGFERKICHSWCSCVLLTVLSFL